MQRLFSSFKETCKLLLQGRQIIADMLVFAYRCCPRGVQYLLARNGCRIPLPAEDTQPAPIPDDGLKHALYRQRHFLLPRISLLPQLEYGLTHDYTSVPPIPDARWRTVHDSIDACVRFWPRTREGRLPYFTLYRYVSPAKDRILDAEMLAEVRQVRSLVWRFKYDIRRTSAPQHAAAIHGLVPPFSARLKGFFAQHLQQLVLVCVPASSEETYFLRFFEFSALLCHSTGMTNGMTHMRVVGTKTPRHLGGAEQGGRSLDYRWLYRKHVLLLDDVITTGSTAERFASELRSHGAHVVGCLAVAETLDAAGIQRYIGWHRAHRGVRADGSQEDSCQSSATDG